MADNSQAACGTRSSSSPRRSSSDKDAVKVHGHATVAALLELETAGDDRGRVIGRQGRIAKAMRAVLGGLARRSPTAGSTSSTDSHHGDAQRVAIGLVLTGAFGADGLRCACAMARRRARTRCSPRTTVCTSRDDENGPRCRGVTACAAAEPLARETRCGIANSRDVRERVSDADAYKGPPRATSTRPNSHRTRRRGVLLAPAGGLPTSRPTDGRARSAVSTDHLGDRCARRAGRRARRAASRRPLPDPDRARDRPRDRPALRSGSSWMHRRACWTPATRRTRRDAADRHRHDLSPACSAPSSRSPSSGSPTAQRRRSRWQTHDLRDWTHGPPPQRRRRTLRRRARAW